MISKRLEQHIAIVPCHIFQNISPSFYMYILKQQRRKKTRKAKIATGFFESSSPSVTLIPVPSILYSSSSNRRLIWPLIPNFFVFWPSLGSFEIFLNVEPMGVYAWKSFWVYTCMFGRTRVIIQIGLRISGILHWTPKALKMVKTLQVDEEV